MSSPSDGHLPFHYVSPAGNEIWSREPMSPADLIEHDRWAAEIDALPEPDPDDDPDADGYGWERRALRGIE
jgi:hypothetical protein